MTIQVIELFLWDFYNSIILLNRIEIKKSMILSGEIRKKKNFVSEITIISNCDSGMQKLRFFPPQKDL